MNKQHAIQLYAFIERFNQENHLYTIQTKPLTITPYLYGKAINDFQDYFLNNHLMRLDCYDIEKEFKKNYSDVTWLNNLNQEKVLQCISFIIRRDRFVDGFIALMIKNKTLPVLLDKLRIFYDL